MNGWERFKQEREARNGGGSIGSPSATGSSGGFAEFQRRKAAQNGAQSSGSRGWQQYLQQTQGIQRTSSDSDIYRKSGMDALREDAHALTGGLTHYFQNEHGANSVNSQYRQKTRSMLDAITKEREYFNYYADAFTAEDLKKYNDELDAYEAQLKRYDGAFGNGYGRAADKESAIWGSGYSALSNSLTAFDKDVRSATQGGKVVTDETEKDLQQRRTALSSKLDATKRYMEQNAALFTPQERKQWQEEFDRYTSYLNNVGSYLNGGIGMKNPWTGKSVHTPANGLPTSVDAQQQEDVSRKVTSVIDSFGKAGKLGITPDNAQQERDNASGTVQRSERELARLDRQYAELEQRLRALPDTASAERNAIVQQMQEIEGQRESDRRVIEKYNERAAAADAVAQLSAREKDFAAESAASQKRIQELEAQLKAARIPGGRRVGNQWVSEPVDAAEIARIEAEISKEKTRLAVRQRQLAEFSSAAEYYKYYSLMNNEDFEEKSKPQPDVYKHNPYGVSDLQEFIAKHSSISSDELMQNPEYGYINGMQGRKDSIKAHYASYNGEQDSLESYDYMTDDERHIFNYLWATEGKQPAMAFLETLKPTLDYRHGSSDASESNGWLVDYIWNPAQRGFRNTLRNVEALFTGEELDPLPWEYETSIRSENSSRLGRGVINAAASFGQMVPSMVLAAPAGPIAGALGAGATAAGLIGGGVGAGVTWLTSGAAGYQEGLRQGMTREQASKYGIMTGASEGLLQFALSGIPGIKGWGAEQLGEIAAGKITNAFGRWAVKYGASMASEVLEENVQNYLDPLFVTMLTGKDYEAPGWEEFVDTTLSTLLLTGVTNLASAPRDIINEIGDTTAIREAELRLVDAALTFDKDSPIYTAGLIIKERLDRGGIVKGEDFRNILHEIGATDAEVKKINSGRFTAEDMDALRNTTERKATAARQEVYSERYQSVGWTKQNADAAAVVIDKAVRGESLRNADIQKLRLNTQKGAQALSDVFGISVERAKNNREDANRIFRAAEMQYRVALNEQKYGGVELDVRTLPSTQESADAILANPAVQEALKEIADVDFTGNYNDQSQQIIRGLEGWWLGNAEQYTPVSASEQAARWRAEHPQENTQLNIDNAANSGYTEENGGVSYDGNRMDRGMAEGVPIRQGISGTPQAWGERGTAPDGRRSQAFPRRDISQGLHQAFEQSGVVATELYNFDADKAAFSAALDEARNTDKEHGWCVTPQPVENLQGKRTYMDADGTIGFVLADGGDIEGVFKNNQLNHTRRAMNGVMPQAIADGGIKLDCYGDRLVWLYETYGFVPVARVEFNEEYANPGWDASKGTPYIYFMMHNGDSAETVAANIGQYEHMTTEQLDALPTYGKDGYEDAMNYRDSLLAQREVSVGAARSGFDPYTHAANTYGTIEPGENPARVVDVPNSTDGVTQVSKIVRTAEEAGATAESAIPQIEKATLDGMFSYNPVTNEERRARAQAWFDNYGNTETAYDEWIAASARRKVRGMSLDTYGNGIYLYAELMANAQGAENAQMRQRYERQAINVLSTLQKAATEAGQLVQMTRMFKQLTPESRVVSLQQSIDNLNESLGAYAGTKVTMDERLAQQWLDAMRSGNEALAQEAQKNIYHDIAAQVPGTFMEKWGAWRYLCMLGNPKTIIRNLGGNIAMMPAKALKDKFGALLELGIDKSERTKFGGILSLTEEGRAMLSYAKGDFATSGAKDIALGAGKYDDSSVGGQLQEAIREEHGKLPGVLGSAQDVVDSLMNNETFGDGAFLQHHYAVAFAEAMRARGYTVTDIQQGRVPNAQLDSVRAYAINQAQKATYRDINAFSKLVRNIRFRGESAGAVFGNMVIEGVLPFKATPANVLVRAAEYGPLGVAKAIGEWARNRAIQISRSGVENGKLNGRVAREIAGKEMTSGVQIIEDLASGLSGMAIFGLGVLLKSLGIVSGAADDEDDRLGIQARSLNIGGISISLDWLSPAAVPFFTGVAVAEAWKDPHKSAIDAVSDSIGAMFQPLLEMSMLSSVQDLLDTMNYGDGASAENLIYAAFVQPFFSYLAQGIPTLMSQIARTVEPNSRYTYTGDISGSMARRLAKSAAQVLKKIPFVDWRQYDYVDEWGRAESNGNVLERIFNNFVSPAYVSEIEVTDADEEIMRLEAATGENVSPSRRSYSITMNGEKHPLSGEEYERYSKEYGERALEMMTVLMASSQYAQMDDDQKVAALKDVLQLADEYGKHAAISDYTPKSENKLYTLTKTGLSITEAYAAKTVSKQYSDDPAIGATTAAARFSNWVSHQNWTEAQKKAVNEAYGRFSSHITAGTEKYDELTDVIGADKALSVVNRLAELTPEEGEDSVTVTQKIDAIAGMSLSDGEKWDAFRLYKDDWRIDFFRDEELNPSVYAAYLAAVPEYRLTAKGKKTGEWTTTTIRKWLRTTDYSHQVKAKVEKIATMDKPQEDDE